MTAGSNWSRLALHDVHEIEYAWPRDGLRFKTEAGHYLLPPTPQAAWIPAGPASSDDVERRRADPRGCSLTQDSSRWAGNRVRIIAVSTLLSRDDALLGTVADLAYRVGVEADSFFQALGCVGRGSAG